MRRDDLVAELDAYFRVPDVENDDWAPGFEDCYPDPYWREYVEPGYEGRWNGLMVRGADEVSQAFTCVFPSDAVVAGLPDGAFLFSEHPLDFAERSGFHPLARASFEAMRARRISLYNAHAPLDMHPEVSPSRLIATGLGLSDLDEYGPIADGIPGGACISGTSDLTLDALTARLADVLGGEIPITAPTRYREEAGRVAVVGGGGADLEYLDLALERGCQTYVTGNAAHEPEHPFFASKHRDFRVRAAEAAVSLVDGTHYGTEKPPQLAMAAWFERLGVPAEFVPDGPKL